MTTAAQLQTTLEQTQADLVSSWPEIAPYLSTVSSLASKQSSQFPSQLDSESIKITQEERSQLLNQLQAITALPAGTFDEKTAQELAANLSYSIGHRVSFTVDDNQLTYAHGSLRVVPAIVGSSTLSTATLWPDDPTSTPRKKVSEKNDAWSLWISPRDFPVTVRSSWLEPWFLYQSVLILNPQAMLGVVATIKGILTNGLHRNQFGASRAVIQAGQFWAPRNLGQCIVCFLGESLKNGTVINLAAKNN